jgi:hypothetical protein
VTSPCTARHATVLARAKGAVAPVEAGKAWGSAHGRLHEFNQEVPPAACKLKVDYSQATARLRPQLHFSRCGAQSAFGWGHQQKGSK